MAQRSRFVAAALLLGAALGIGVLATSLASDSRAEPPVDVRSMASARSRPRVPRVTISFPEPGPGVLVPLGLLAVWRIVVRKRGLNA